MTNGPSPFMPPHPDIESVLLTGAQIAQRVRALGAQIERDYAGRDLVLVGVLKGGLLFLADLMRAVSLPHRFELVEAASYGSATTSSGVVSVWRRPRFPLAGCDVLLVEDILDTGLTTQALLREFHDAGAVRVDLCVLLEKRRPRLAEIRPRYVGFEIDDRFVVGYGLDFNERYRHLDCIGILKPSVYQS